MYEQGACRQIFHIKVISSARELLRSCVVGPYEPCVDDFRRQCYRSFMTERRSSSRPKTEIVDESLILPDIRDEAEVKQKLKGVEQR